MSADPRHPALINKLWRVAMATLTQTLRCIGQDLERFSTIKDIAIESSAGEYIVRLTVNSPTKQQAPWLESLENGLRKMRRTGTKRKPADEQQAEAPGGSRSFQLRYTSKDIDFLEREGIAKRRNPRGTPDFLSLSHILRTAAAQVEKKNGQLIKITRHFQSENIQSLVIKFKSYNGEEREEQYIGADIYNLCVHWYKQRNGGADKIAIF
jgi:hypothetical protein